MVNTLFNNDIFTHNQITTKNENALVLNLDFYGIAK